MVKYLFNLCLILVVSAFSANAQEIIFKIKKEYHSSAKSSVSHLSSLSQLMNAYQLEEKRIFPSHTPLQKSEIKKGKVDLSAIFSVEANDQRQAQEILARLQSDKHLEYAEFAPVNRLISYQPNDTANSRQWYLSSVRAFEAWDIEKGDTSVYIAITDTGSDTDHEDFGEATYRNHNDPINNVDDDGDGFIDNYYGWDTGNDDASVDPDNGQSHGMHVAGIASSATDNVTGISGCGFDTRIMTVKIDDFSGRLVGAYQGVIYAADQGAPIINCSWGSYFFSSFGEDIINYAAINRGALVICGAGNGPFSGPNAGVGAEDRFYPAAYENAMAIGSLIQNDTVKASSNYGYWLDIFAPGEDMWSTNAFGGYSRNGGTSMAAPVVAGAAALIKSQNPNYSAKQIWERLINSGVSVESVNDNKYRGKMGAGKVDFFNAVANDSLPGIRMENIRYSNGRTQNVGLGDSLLIRGLFTNYLAASSGVTVEIEELNGFAQPLVSQISLPALASLGEADNEQNPFIFSVNQGLTLNQRLEFKLTIQAGNYRRVQHFSTTINTDYFEMANDEISITVGSDGSFGYVGPFNQSGNGVRFKNGASLLNEGSFMVGNSPSYVTSKFRGANNSYDEDFISLSPTRELIFANSELASAALYNDGNFSSPARLEIAQTNYFYDSTYTDNAMLINYIISNVGGVDLNNIYAGLIADWDIVEFARNRVAYDSLRKMGISSSVDTSIVTGLMAISHPSLANHFAISNPSATGAIDPSDGFNRTEKFAILEGGTDSAGFNSPNGVDILDAISMGPFDLPADSSISLTFAILVAEDLNKLTEASDSALSIFNRFPIGISEEESTQSEILLYPNPAQEVLNIKQLDVEGERLEIRIYDLQGRLVFEKSLPPFQENPLDLSRLKNGVYLIQLQGKDQSFQDKLVISKGD